MTEILADIQQESLKLPQDFDSILHEQLSFADTLRTFENLATRDKSIRKRPVLKNIDRDVVSKLSLYFVVIKYVPEAQPIEQACRSNGVVRSNASRL